LLTWRAPLAQDDWTIHSRKVYRSYGLPQRNHPRRGEATARIATWDKMPFAEQLDALLHQREQLPEESIYDEWEEMCADIKPGGR